MAIQTSLVSFDDFIAAARRYGHPTMAIQFAGECEAYMQLGTDSHGFDHELAVLLTKEQCVELVGEYQANGMPVLPCGPNV